MASWTDKAPQFNPYVQQLPVEAMVSVGMEKQRRYDEGIQRIQSSIDRVAGLDIMRDVDRKYLEDKLTQLNTQLRTFAASDFSDQQLTNSLSGLASKVGKDKTIQSAVLSTAKARKELGKMEIDRQEGKLDPSNEYYFSRSFNEWLNNPEAGAGFGTSYIPHFDVFKFAKEVFDQVKPDNMTFDQVFLLGPDGNPVVKNGQLEYSPYMTRLIKEGKAPDKVKQTIDNIFSDPRVAQQLNISGIYNYRSLQGEDLKKILGEQKKEILAGYEQAIQQYKARKSVNEDVTAIIDDLETRKRILEETYDQYSIAADSNPDAIRSLLHREAVRSQYATMFGVMKTEQLVMSNPAWQATFDLMKEQNQHNQWMSDYNLRKWVANDASKRGWTELELRKAGLDLERMGLEGKMGAWNAAGEFTPADQSSDFGLIAHQGYLYQAAVETYSNASNKFLADMILNTNEKAASRIAEFEKKGATPEGAIEMIIEEEAQKQNMTPDEYRKKWLVETMSIYERMTPEERSLRPSLVDSYELYRKAERSFTIQDQINSGMTEYVKRKMGDSYGELDLSEIRPQVIDYNGTEYELSPSEIADLAAYMITQPWYKGAVSSTFKAIFNHRETEMLKEESNKALRRLQEAGLGELVELFKKDISWEHFGDLHQEKVIAQRWGQVKKVAETISDFNNSEIARHKSDYIQNTLTVSPNMKAPLFSGDLESDRNILHKITTYASNHSSNISPDFKDFKKHLASVDLADPQGDYTMSRFVSMDTDNNPQLEIVLYKAGNRIGGVTLTQSEARGVGVNLDTIYESREAQEMGQLMRSRKGQTSKGDPSQLSTYRTGHDYYFNKHDIPALASIPGYDLKINIKNTNGTNYIYFYATDGITEDVRELRIPGNVSIDGVIQTVKTYATPAFVEQILAEKNAREQRKSNQ